MLPTANYSIGESRPWAATKKEIMGKSLTCLNAASLILAASILTAAPAAANGDTTASLRADGWRVVEKSDRQEKRPGVAPYENLTRVIQITTFVLAKDGQRKVCDMAYDSQKDKITETCRTE